MKTLIIYASQHGTTEQCAIKLSEKLEGNVEICNIKKEGNVDITQYDKVIIGGSIYGGKIQKEIVEFCSQNISTLKEKKIGLFICCMSKHGSEKQIKLSFPEELLTHAIAKQSFGGEFKFNKMSFLERTIAKIVSKTLINTDDRLRNLDSKQGISLIDEESIVKFSQLMNSK